MPFATATSIWRSRSITCSTQPSSSCHTQILLFQFGLTPLAHFSSRAPSASEFQLFQLTARANSFTGKAVSLSDLILPSHKRKWTGRNGIADFIEAGLLAGTGVEHKNFHGCEFPMLLPLLSTKVVDPKISCPGTPMPPHDALAHLQTHRRSSNVVANGRHRSLRSACCREVLIHYPGGLLRKIVSRFEIVAEEANLAVYIPLQQHFPLSVGELAMNGN